MPKYYVTSLDRSAIVSAKDELEACVLASRKLMVTTVGISWIISERGFGEHEDDVLIPDHYIITELIRRSGRDKL